MIRKNIPPLQNTTIPHRHKIRGESREPRGLRNPAVRFFRKIDFHNFVLLLFLTVLAACSPSNLAISDAWARSAGFGETSAIYFEVSNSSNQADALIAASTNVAGTVQLHQSQMNAEGVMTMQHQHEIPIPANSKVVFAPGGYHAMLMDLKQELNAGETFVLTLTFKKAGTIDVTVTVRSP